MFDVRTTAHPAPHRREKGFVSASAACDGPRRRNGFKKVPLSRAQYFERFTCLSGYTSSKLKKFWHCGRGVPV